MLDFNEARDYGVAMAPDGPYANQTDNHTSISQIGFNRPDALPAAQPTASKQ